MGLGDDMAGRRRRGVAGGVLSYIKESNIQCSWRAQAKSSRHFIPAASGEVRCLCVSGSPQPVSMLDVEDVSWRGVFRWRAWSPWQSFQQPQSRQKANII